MFTKNFYFKFFQYISPNSDFFVNLVNFQFAKNMPYKVFDLVTVILDDSFTVWTECMRLVQWERTLSTLLGGCVELTVAFRIDFGSTARLEPDVTYSTCPRRTDTPNLNFPQDEIMDLIWDKKFERKNTSNLSMEIALNTFTENGRWLKHGHNRLIVMPMARPEPYARPRRPWTGPYLVSKVEALRTIGFSGRPQCNLHLIWI